MNLFYKYDCCCRHLTLTALIHLQELDLLRKLYQKVYMPEAVAEELKSLIKFGYDISFLQQRGSRSNCISKELNADLLLIDEKLGKEYAEVENIICKGAVGILIEAKQKGFIQALKPLPDDLLINLKFRLSEKIYKLALSKAGE
jgi:uncharacterized protein